MIDGIGKTGGRIALSGNSAAERSATIAPAAQGRNGAPATLIGEIAGFGPPIDTDKVAAIRAAIAEGRYPVDPARIASAMLALDLPAKDPA